MTQSLPSRGPLAAPVFRMLFIATAVSNLGTWMQEVGRAWLMTDLTTSPTLIALLQSAAMAAMVFVVLPAGIMADLLDRRRLILAGHVWLIAVSGALALVAAFGLATPALILALTFAGAAGAAFVSPPAQAVLAEIVGEAQLAQAMVLNGISFNVARAVGPALGGALVALAGVPAVFALNAVSFGAVLVVFLLWRPAARPAATMPRERPMQALRAGLRYARHAPELRDTLLRTLAFALPASALWALLPVVARRVPGAGPLDYGILLGLVGAGSALTGLALPRLRARLTAQQLLAMAGGLLGLALLAVTVPALVWPALVMAGVGWMVTLALLMAGAQTATPPWVRGRAAALFMLALGLGLAIGSAGWGALASQAGLVTALVAAGMTQIATALATRHLRAPGTTSDAAVVVEPRWPQPQVACPATSGPVFVTIAYDVVPGTEADFTALMQRIAQTRRSSGTLEWDLFRHGAEPGQWLETNLVASWEDHLRQRSRQSAEAQTMEATLRAFLKPGTEPRVTHWLAG
ncbi:MAG: MFS transporter [Roseovarius sp.]|uniref:MFS transporter n=1 Tax=Roseovarius sp. TaxID=1486281 RepID=UPI001B73C6B8|nr:MFS transporter [Roseovarius sp.]MBQ0751865.1 MFS transporter [Roseovarius sp.]